jgi:hypothetical protein
MKSFSFQGMKCAKNAEKRAIFAQKWDFPSAQEEQFSVGTLLVSLHLSITLCLLLGRGK